MPQGPSSDVLRRNSVGLTGVTDARPIMFAHGFGCDQNMWRFVAPEFESDHRVILFDHVGAGGSDLSAYSTERYATLDGDARDMVEIGETLGVMDGVFVGHSDAAMIGVLAHRMRAGMFSHLVLVDPSPYYLNDGDYQGGFTRADIKGLLDAMANNYLGWSSDMAPAIVGRPDRPELGEELTISLCRTDPAIAEELPLDPSRRPHHQGQRDLPGADRIRPGRPPLRTSAPGSPDARGTNLPPDSCGTDSRCGRVGPGDRR